MNGERVEGRDAKKERETASEKDEKKEKEPKKREERKNRMERVAGSSDASCELVCWARASRCEAEQIKNVSLHD